MWKRLRLERNSDRGKVWLSRNAWLALKQSNLWPWIVRFALRSWLEEARWSDSRERPRLVRLLLGFLVDGGPRGSPICDERRRAGFAVRVATRRLWQGKWRVQWGNTRVGLQVLHSQWGRVGVGVSVSRRGRNVQVWSRAGLVNLCALLQASPSQFGWSAASRSCSVAGLCCDPGWQYALLALQVWPVWL